MAKENITREKTISKSIRYFENGLYCSEALLKAFNEEYKLGLPKKYLKIATGFGAGLGAAKCCCGCLTGGVMVLSLVKGRNTAEESEDPAFELVSSLHDQFKKEYKFTCCRALTKKVEWGSEEHVAYCSKIVGRTAELISDLLTKKEEVKNIGEETA